MGDRSSSSNKPLAPLQAQHRFQTFLALQWYEEAIKFLFTFVAKTSEILLAVGLVTSTANFLTDGQVMGTTSGIASAWAWAQALAIDSSLSVTFMYVFACLKQRDWLKATCYGLLTGLLAFVAGTITNVDTLSHAVHITMASATSQVGLDIKLLTTLRAIAVVGFVLLSRLKEVSFKELYTAPLPPPALAIPEETEALLSQLIAQALARQGQMVMIEESEDSSSPLNPMQSGRSFESALSSNPFSLSEEPESQEERLQQAYKELQAEGQHISGRTLAARAHVRRTTCNQWLAMHHPETVNDTG